MLSVTGLTGVSEGEARQALSRVLGSEEFARSERLRRFLTYVTRRALEGEAWNIKEYNIAVEVYDRDAGFDPKTDNIVRMEARRLRQQLNLYYAGTGQTDPVVIEIPKGGYAPAFRVAGRADIAAAAPEPVLSGRRAWPYWMTAGAILSAVAAVWFWSPWARTGPPQDYRVEGTTIRLLDANGRTCWFAGQSVGDPSHEKEIADKVVIADIDADGRREVLVNTVPEGEASGNLRCYEEDGRLRWRAAHGGRRTFAGRTFEASYIGRFLRPVRARGRPLLLTAAIHSIWYPAQAALRDPKTGAVVEEYWHPGAFSDCVVADLDQDGQHEVLLAAVNNPGPGLGHAALVVLNLPFSSQRRLAEADSPAPAGPVGGGEAGYVLFPLTDVARVMGKIPLPQQLRFDPHSGTTLIVPLPESGGIVYRLGRDLRVVDARPSDNFAALHRRYESQGLLDHEMKEGEYRRLGSAVRLAQAADGNSPALEAVWKR